MRALAARISFAERTIASHSGGHLQSGKTELVQEEYDPSREAVMSAYKVPSYRGHGESKSIPIQPQPRSRSNPWFIRKAIDFHARLGNFFDFVESFGPLPDKDLYIDQYKDLHWVSLWLVEVNQEFTWDELPELAEVIHARAEQLSGGPVYYVWSVKDRVLRQLIKLDEDRIVAREIPGLLQHNPRYLTDMGIKAGGWLLFVSMVVPKVVKEGKILSYFDEVTVALPLHALAFIVDGKSFERIFGVSWNDYLSENGDQPATLRMLPVTTNRRAHFKQLKTLVEQRVAVKVDKNSAYFGNLYLLNQSRLNWLPPAARTRARELTDDLTLPLVESRREGWWEPDWTGAFIYAVISPAELQSGLARLRPEAESAGQAEPTETPEQLIKRFRRPGLVAAVIDNTWLVKLGAYLVSLTRRSSALSRYVQKVLDELGSTDRGGLALAFARNALDSDLDGLAGSPNGRLLLVRLYDELVSGDVGETEEQAWRKLATTASRVNLGGSAQQQAERILMARVRSRSVEVVRRRLEKSRLIFPFKLSGPTVYDDAPIAAERLADGRIRVKMNQRVEGTLAFRAETQTLPDSVFTTGLVLDADEWIRVKLYDEGGIVVTRPALFLLELSHIAIKSTSGKIIATAIIAGSFGFGAVLPVAGGSRVLYYLDLAATALGFLGTIVDDHRGWIIKTFGKYGQAFVDAVGVAQQLAAVYGLGRLAFAAPRAISNLRSAWRNWRSRRAFWKLVGEDLRRAEEISQKAEQFLNNAEEALKAMRNVAGHGDVETPVPIEAPVESPPAEGGAAKQKPHESPDVSPVPKKVQASNPAEARILEAGRGGAVPSLEQIDAELSIVERSQPRKIPGGKEYVEEVELSNGHTWRRKPDGTWCRHSNGQICVPGGRGKAGSQVVSDRVAPGQKIMSEQDIDKFLEPARPKLDSPPASVKTPEDQQLWEIYYNYIDERLGSMRQDIRATGKTSRDAPRTFESFRKQYTQNPALLKALRGRMYQGRVSSVIDDITSGTAAHNLGISKVPIPEPKEMLYPDHVIHRSGSARTEGYTAVSTKSRDFRTISPADIPKIVMDDLREALVNYYGLRYVRRIGLDVTGSLIRIDEVVLNYERLLVPEKFRDGIQAIAESYSGVDVKIGFFDPGQGTSAAK